MILLFHAVLLVAFVFLLLIIVKAICLMREGYEAVEIDIQDIES